MSARDSTTLVCQLLHRGGRMTQVQGPSANDVAQEVRRGLLEAELRVLDPELFRRYKTSYRTDQALGVLVLLSLAFSGYLSVAVYATPWPIAITLLVWIVYSRGRGTPKHVTILSRFEEDNIKQRATRSGGESVTYNNVTLNFDNGSTFTGPLSVGQNIKVAYEAAAKAPNDIDQRLHEVVRLATHLIESIESPEAQNDVSTQLKSFAEEAKKERPSRWMLDISSKGLIEAAKTVAALTGPIITAVRAVMDLVPPPTDG